jgi:hypothetical protein
MGRRAFSSSDRFLATASASARAASSAARIASERCRTLAARPIDPSRISAGVL